MKDNITRSFSISKAQRYAQTKGLQGWVAVLALLGLMCIDQFVVDIPYENVVFPILAVCAACMSPAKYTVLVIT